MIKHNCVCVCGRAETVPSHDGAHMPVRDSLYRNVSRVKFFRVDFIVTRIHQF